jgi:hypothetical protein
MDSIDGTINGNGYEQGKEVGKRAMESIGPSILRYHDYFSYFIGSRDG